MTEPVDPRNPPPKPPTRPGDDITPEPWEPGTDASSPPPPLPEPDAPIEQIEQEREPTATRQLVDVAALVGLVAERPYCRLCFTFIVPVPVAIRRHVLRCVAINRFIRGEG